MWQTYTNGQAARAEKWEEREQRERYRVHQHAKKQGVQDVDSWLMSVGHRGSTASMFQPITCDCISCQASLIEFLIEFCRSV